MNRLRGIKGVLIDLSGTLHIENELIPGSIEALDKLRKDGSFKIKFVTNTTKESKQYLHTLLNNLGLKIELNEIYTSLTAARNLIEKNSIRPMLLVENSAMEDFDGINTESPNAVVIGLAPMKFNYEHLNEAFRLILNGAKLIGIHKARYYKRKDGLALGPGAFISGLEYSTGTKALVVGKPNKEFFLSSISEFDIKPDECIMIGDDCLDDVEGAQNAGMNAILVKTGKYRQGDELKLKNQSTLVVDKFADAIELILNNK